MARRQQFQQLIENYHLGMEKRDINAIMNCYADDAEIKIVDQSHPPSSPRLIHGKNEIRSYLEDVFGRDLTHKIQAEAVSDRFAAFTEDCEYGDGTKVLVNEMCELVNGKIAKQTTVQAWDPA